MFNASLSRLERGMAREFTALVVANPNAKSARSWSHKSGTRHQIWIAICEVIPDLDHWNLCFGLPKYQLGLIVDIVGISTCPRKFFVAKMLFKCADSINQIYMSRILSFLSISRDTAMGHQDVSLSNPWPELCCCHATGAGGLMADQQNMWFMHKNFEILDAKIAWGKLTWYRI